MWLVGSARVVVENPRPTAGHQRPQGVDQRADRAQYMIALVRTGEGGDNRHAGLSRSGCP